MFDRDVALRVGGSGRLIARFRLGWPPGPLGRFSELEMAVMASGSWENCRQVSLFQLLAPLFHTSCIVVVPAYPSYQRPEVTAQALEFHRAELFNASRIR